MVKRNHIDSIRFWELLFLNQLKNAMQIRQLAGREMDRRGEPDEDSKVLRFTKRAGKEPRLHGDVVFLPR